jgi:glycosyltransferase involved in cell wall biosynthesis
MARIHLISHTPLDAPGGVPRFNRYLKRVLEEVGHDVMDWSAWNLPQRFVGHGAASEVALASTLSRYLYSHIDAVFPDDVVIGDGFWCGDFAFLGHRRVISVAHGIWSHLTKEDADAGVPPENPSNHAAQIRHRREHLRRGLPIVAVSRFISEQMRLQWGFESRVINNAVDPSEIPDFEPNDWWRKYEDLACNRPIVVVHGVNDRGNLNKGWDHIEACRQMLEHGAPRTVEAHLSNMFRRMNSPHGRDASRRAFSDMTPESIGRAVAKTAQAVREGKRMEQYWPLKMMLLSLDEFHAELGCADKMQTLQHADAVLIPSGYEGNSYFALEAMSCGVPVVAYDVGLFREIADEGLSDEVGVVMPRRERSPQRTAAGLNHMLTTGRVPRPERALEKVASFQAFRDGWCGMIEEICRSS